MGESGDKAPSAADILEDLPIGSHHPVPDDAHEFQDTLDMQVAIDSLQAGNEEHLKNYLAYKMGLDPTKCSLRQSKWEAPPPEEEGGPKMYFVGKLDDVHAPGDERPSIYERKEPQLIDFRRVEEPFRYESLDHDREIRLLRLGPKNDDGVTEELELKTFLLDDAPRYFCLSYVWGTPEPIMPVTCNGSVMMTTQNLYHALRTCFNRFTDEWLWADGICINQGDHQERAQQVILMGEIYKRAAMVLAHPGHYQYGLTEDAKEAEAEEALTREEGEARKDELHWASFDGSVETRQGENAQEAISIMSFLSRIWESSTPFSVKSDAEWEKYKLPDISTEDGRETWKRLISFWGQDWFCRAWVLQELVLAKKVVVLYADTVMSLDAVMDFWERARRHGLPRLLRIGPLADECARVVHLTPASYLKGLIENRTSTKKEEGISHGSESGEEGSEEVAEAESTVSRVKDEATQPSDEAEENDVSDQLEVLEKEETSQDDDLSSTESSKEEKQPIRLLDLLCMTRTSLATDNRDKVYALLGLAEDEVAKSLVPNYSPENTVTRVFIDVACKLVQAGLGHELLHHAGRDTNTPDLPSWVPDWTFQSRSALNKDLYRCMGSTRPNLRLLEETTARPKLVVRGVVLSSIKFAGMAWRYYSHDDDQPNFASFQNKPDFEIPPFNDEDGRNVILTMALIAAQDLGSAEKRYSDEGLSHAIARNLAADCSWRGERIGPLKVTSEKAGDSNDANGEFSDALQAFQSFYKQGPESEEDLVRPCIRVHQTAIFKWLLDFDEEKEDELQRRMVPYTVSMQEASRGRRYAALSGKSIKQKREDKKLGKKDFGMDDRGFIANVPWNAEKKDLVVMLEGFSTPFVVRKRDDSEEFELIGDCYVHGVMDGELLRDAEESLELSEEQIGVDENGRRYAVRAPDGCAKFEDFVFC